MTTHFESAHFDALNTYKLQLEARVPDNVPDIRDNGYAEG